MEYTMKKLLILALVFASCAVMRAQQVAFTFDAGTSLVTVNGEPNTSAASFCGGIGLLIQDSTSKTIPFFAFEHNSWSLSGVSGSVNMGMIGLKFLTSSVGSPVNLYFTLAAGGASVHPYFIMYALPGVGVDLRMSPNSAFFIDTKYPVAISGDGSNFTALRAGFRFGN